MFSVILYSLFRVNKFTDVDKETKEKLDEHFKVLNMSYESQYGFTWKASENLYWIELKKLGTQEILHLLIFVCVCFYSICGFLKVFWFFWEFCVLVQV